jgi:hypothetical protein
MTATTMLAHQMASTSAGWREGGMFMTSTV